MKLRHLIISIALITLSACATATDTMRGFVGRDITSIVAQYGPPTHEFDLPDGRRAFQWRILDTNYVPATTIYEEKSKRSRTRGTSTTIGGYVDEKVCFYTMYAEPAAAGRWRVTGFEEPTFACD